MVEVDVIALTGITGGVKCRFMGRIDRLNKLPILPADLKKHLIMEPGKEVNEFCFPSK